ncbi:hypothetical protein IG631_07015 [Alternaria alternata]|jgi:hypothetical protein|nr:hypothetical protein IG631_07015 [Alternaria alternata]
MGHREAERYHRIGTPQHLSFPFQRNLMGGASACFPIGAQDGVISGLAGVLSLGTFGSIAGLSSPNSHSLRSANDEHFPL